MHITDTQKAVLLVGLLFFFWLIYQLTPILTPFLLGAFFAYLGNPVVARLVRTRIGLSRFWAVLLVFCLIIATVVVTFIILLPLLQEQIMHLLAHTPEMIDRLHKTMTSIAQRFGIAVVDLASIKQSLTQHWQDIARLTGQLYSGLASSGQALALWLGYLFIIPVVTFYLLRDWDHLLEQLIKLIPQPYQPALIGFGAECDAILSSFFRGQLLVMLGQAIIYSVGLTIVGLEFALLIGMLAGLVSFIPYLGFFVGFITAAVAAFFQFQDGIYLFYLLLVFGLGQLIEATLLSPLLIGDKIGLHPVAVLFAVMAGGQLFGFFGILLALPVAALLTVALRHVRAYYGTAS